MATETAITQRGAHLPAQNWSQPQSLREAQALAEILSKSPFIPAAYKGKPGDIVACMFVAQQLDMPLPSVLTGYAVINGKPSAYGDLLLALARRSPEFRDIEETMEGRADGRVAQCVVKRRGQTPCVRRFSVEDAKHAGLWNKTGPWQQYPQRMLQMRARSWALRDSFADALCGLIGAEEAMDMPAEPSPSVVEVKRTTNVHEAIAQVAEKFGAKVDEVEVDPAAECREDMKSEVLAAFGKWSDARELVEEAIGRWPGKSDPPTLDECQRIRAAVAEHVAMTQSDDLPAGHDDLLEGDA